jgi:2-keto-4-pentenoate hydratase/2-oxohepta-3-ene-1,7-dioic acid hydratase in catechol pathway
MKLVSFRTNGAGSFGLVDGHDVVDLGSAGLGQDLKEFILRGGCDAVRNAPRGDVQALDGIEFLPVIPNPDKIICIGINYRSHVLETGREMPTKPMIFTRWPDTQTGHRQPIIRPRVSEKLDFEGELAVVIGKAARHVKAERALDHVAGYSAYNDGSVRDWQRHTAQFTPGKNFPMTGGFGPWLVTADEIPDPSKLHLQTRLNGEVVQDANTDDLIFDVPSLVEYCSSFTTLNPGDVIITGTTGGVGAFRQPPIWMKPGDTVEVEISRIGVLVNSIADEE